MNTFTNGTVSIDNQTVGVQAARPCPSCGHCPTCGRGGHQAAPWPYGINVPPFWVQPWQPPINPIGWPGTTIVYGTTDSLPPGFAVTNHGTNPTLIPS